MIRLQVSFLPARNQIVTGVQTSSKLSVMVKYVERGKVTFLPGAILGKHYRKACYWSGDIENVEQANAIL